MEGFVVSGCMGLVHVFAESTHAGIARNPHVQAALVSGTALAFKDFM